MEKVIRIFLITIIFKLTVINGANPIFIFLQSEDILPYQKAFLGISDELKRNKVIDNNALVYRFILTREKETNQKIKTQVNYLLKRKLETLIISIGTKAVKMVLNERWYDKSPVIFCMVGKYKNLNLHLFKGKITGVSLELNPKIQLEYLREILPNHKKVGLLYDVKFDLSFAKHAQIVAKLMNIELIEYPINTLEDIPKIYNDIFNKVNVIWLIPSSRIFSKVIIEKIIHNAIIHRIPVFGPSKFLAEKGALFGLSPDWYEIGRQTGNLIMKILSSKHKDLSQFEIEEPKKIKIIINIKITDFLGYKIPAKWIDKVEFFPIINQK